MLNQKILHINSKEKEVTLDNFGKKAVNLFKLYSNDVKIPDSYFLSTEVFLKYKKSKKINSNTIQELEKIRKKFNNKIAIRSSATCEDNDNISMAGVFKTVYIENFQDNIEKSIIEIYEQALSNDVLEFLNIHNINHDKTKLGLIIQPLILPDIAGTIYSEINSDQTLIQYSSHYGKLLADGEIDGTILLIDTETKKIEQTKNYSHLQIKQESIEYLLKQKEKIKKIFSNKPQDIEFIISDEKIFILQARTLTTKIKKIDIKINIQDTIKNIKREFKNIVKVEKKELGLNNVILSNSNFSEILPTPQQMDIGIFQSIFTGLNGKKGGIQIGRKKIGYPIDDQSVGYLHYLGGKPYFSIAKDSLTYYQGIPNNIESYKNDFTKEYLKLIDKNNALGLYPEMNLYQQEFKNEKLRIKYPVNIKEYSEKNKEFLNKINFFSETFEQTYYKVKQLEANIFVNKKAKINLKDLTETELNNNIHEILGHLRLESAVNFVIASRIAFYSANKLKNFLKQNLKIDSNKREQYFIKLNQGLNNSLITQSNLEIAKSNSLINALKSAKQKIGHFNNGEMLEIRHSLLSEDPKSLLAYTNDIYKARKEYISKTEAQKEERIKIQNTIVKQLKTNKIDEFKKLINNTQNFMSLRESIKYDFVKEYALIKKSLDTLEKKLYLKKGDIYFIYPTEITKIIKNKKDFTNVIAERRQEFRNYKKIKIPSVLSEKNINRITLNITPNSKKSTIMKGQLLAEGQKVKNGIIVNISDFSSINEARKIIFSYREINLDVILVTKQINLSHDPLIIYSSGVVIENASLVSHGAQRARELGIGAIGGIEIIQLKTGTIVNFEPNKKTINIKQIPNNSTKNIEKILRN